MPTTSFDPRVSGQKMRETLDRTIREILAIEVGHRKLVIHDVEFDDKGLSSVAFAAQRRAKDSGGNYAMSVKVTAELLTSEGQSISRGKVIVGKLPLITQRLTYILGGREYQVTNQFRRMSGVYTRISDRGDVQGVIVGKTGERSQQMKMHLDTSTYQIFIRPVKGSTSKLSVYDLLRAADKSDGDIAQSWGREMVKANKDIKSDERRDRSVISIAKKMMETPHDKSVQPITIANAKDAAIYIFMQLKLWTMDPRVTADTLGTAHTSITPDALMHTGRQVLAVSRGEAHPSTYNNIGHKKLNDPGDLLRDYLLRNKYEIQQAIKNRMGSKSKTVADVARNCLSKRLTAFFRQGGETQLVSEADMTNPLATLVGHRMTTVTGRGGISVGPGMQLGDAQHAHSSHIGFLDPVDTGEKKITGLQLYMTLGSDKVGDQLHSKLYNIKEKKLVLVDPLTADRAVVAFPDDVKMIDGVPKVLREPVRASTARGAIKRVPFSECDYVMPHAQSNFALGASLIPFIDNNNGNRVMMGAKMATQAVSLLNREEPLVQVRSDDNESVTMEKRLGNVSAISSPIDGTILSVSDEEMQIKGLDGEVHKIELYKDFPTNDPKSMLNHEPTVEVGQFIKRGQLLADSNYTRGGVSALGTNLRVGYLPMRGYNYEDGVVISSSASQKLTSQHLYTFKRDCAVRVGTDINAKVADAQEDQAVIINKGFYKVMAPRSAALYPNFNDLQSNGLIKEGSEVHKNHILIAACQRTDQDPARAAFMRSTRIKSAWRGAGIVWDKDSPGVVTRVINMGKNVKVYVRSEEPMGIGDKLVGRYGNKGIVTKVLEDHEMPYAGVDEEGERKHVEVAMHPAGVPGRINIGQLMEIGASKIAEKTGEVYAVKNFDSNSKDRMRELISELKSHGLSDQEVLFDPKTQKPIGSVIMGKQYIQKLTHQVDKKLTARPGGVLPGLSGFTYDINKQPKSGAPLGGQAMGGLGIYTLLGHNARANVRDLQTHHSTYEVAEKPGEYDSDDYWNAVMAGLPLPSAKPTFAVKKFLGTLKAMGVNPTRNGDDLQLIPITDKDVLKQCPHEVKNPWKMIVGKTAKVEKGGLFNFPDGDTRSSRWGHIKLKERVINPVFETPTAVMLGIPINSAKRVFKDRGMSEICRALKRIKVTEEIVSSKGKIDAGARGSDRDLLYRKLKLLKALSKMGLTPYDAYTMKYMPVLPPNMRPISLSGDVGGQGDINTTDINQLYKTVGITNNLMDSMPADSTEEDKKELSFMLYSKIRDAYIDGALDNKGAPINSLLQSAVQPGDASGKHKQSKTGFFQSRLIKRRSELSGRSVITPEPNLKLDQVGIPRKMAMNMYRPFIVRQLRIQGYSTPRAAKILREDPGAVPVREALERAIADRPLLMKRDPALHKHNVLAFYPKIVEGKSIQIHPLVCGGFNADFDGDTMGVWVPSSDDAREEAKNMLPSKNLFGPRGFQLMNAPEWGAAYGIWQLTEWGKPTEAKVSSVSEAYLLHKKGALDISDIIDYKGRQTTAGRMILFDKLPPEYKKGEVGDEVMYGEELNKNRMTTLLSRIAKERPDLYPKMVDDWKDLGNKFAHEKAWSFGLEDFVAHSDIRDKHLMDADKKIEKLKAPSDADKVRIFSVAAGKTRKEVEERLAKTKTNRAYRMTKQSGAMGSKYNQVEQLIIAPLQVQSSSGKTLPNPVRKAYSEGLGVGDYWDAIPGVRTGTLARVRGTSDPGAANKDLVNLNISSVISVEDCKTTSGIQINTSDHDVESRYLSKPIKAGSKSFPAGYLIGPQTVAQIRKYHKSIEVRSPITCKASKGVCGKCVGYTERGNDYSIGENPGIISAQSLSEPLVQMTMNAFHTGGSASGKGADIGDEFKQINQLMSLPKVVRGSAKISPKDTTVVSVDKDTIAGGYTVILNDVPKPIYIPQGVEVFVRSGDILKRGQPLCEGPINPHDLLASSGMTAVRKHLISKLHKIYGDYSVRRRHVEMLVKNLTNSVEVIEDEEADFSPGDHITANQLKRTNEDRKTRRLQPVTAKPILIGINQAVKVATEGDWLAQMNYQRVRASLIDGMAHGSKSSMHGLNPIPGVALGHTMGRTGKSGEY